MDLSGTQFFCMYAFAPVYHGVTDSGQCNSDALLRVHISVATQCTADFYDFPTYIGDGNGNVGEHNPKPGLAIMSVCRA